MCSNVSGFNNTVRYPGFNSKQVKKPVNSLVNKPIMHRALSNCPAKVSFGQELSNKDLALRYVMLDTLNFSRPDIIRSPEALSPKDVIKIMDDQLNLITAAQIEETILASVDKTDRELALKVLQYMCQFANMDGLNKIVAEIQKLEKPSDHLFVQGDSSLASNIAYLNGKGNFKDLNMDNVTNYQHIPNCSTSSCFVGSLLLDEDLLNRLKNDAALLNCIKNSSNFTTLIYPESWINGVNPFNQASLDEIKNKVVDVVNRAKKLQKESAYNVDKAIINALNAPILEEISKLGLQNKFKIISSHSSIENPNAKDIEDLLVPNRITEEDLKRILQEKIPELYRQVVLEILARESKLYTPRTLSILAKQQYQKIIDIANKNNVNNDNIYYYIPEERKSFGMATMIYQLTNKISPEKIVTNLNNITQTPNTKCLLVVLDDFAGSGDTLYDIYKSFEFKLEHKCYTSTLDCIMAPLVSTDKAIKWFNEEINKENLSHKSNDRPKTKLHYCPGSEIKLLENSDWYKLLPKSDQLLIDKILFSKGHRDNSLCLAFPYMAPDNNNYLFAGLFAPFFTLNRKGVKGTEYWKCPTSVNLANEQQHLKETVESYKKSLQNINIFSDYKKMLEKETAEIFEGQMPEDITMYSGSVLNADSYADDMLKYQQLVFTPEPLTTIADKFSASLNDLNAYLNDPQNYVMSNLEEFYAKNTALRDALRKAFHEFSNSYNNFTKDDRTQKKAIEDINNLKDQLNLKIAERIKKQAEKGTQLAEQNKMALKVLINLRDKAELMGKRYNEMLQMIVDTYNKLLPFTNDAVINVNKTFNDTMLLFSPITNIE